ALPPPPPAPVFGLSTPALTPPPQPAAGSAVEGRGGPPMTLGLSKEPPATALPLSLVGGSFALGRATRATNTLAATDEPARATAPEAPTATRAGGQGPPAVAPLAAEASPARVPTTVGSGVKAATKRVPFGL